MRSIISVLVSVFCLVTCNAVHAQTAAHGAYSYLYRANVSCGSGASTSEVATKPTLTCGAGFVILPFIVTEIGVMGPQAHHSDVSGYLSEDLVLPIAPSAKWSASMKGDPIIIAGYTRMFETGHALDFGVGFEHHIDDSHSLQFELRDYLAFANPRQHNVVLRVGWVIGIPD